MIGSRCDNVLSLSVCYTVSVYGDAEGRGVGVKSCTVVFLEWHFLFTSANIFAVEYII